MDAIRLYEFGPADNLRYESVEDPLPGPGQVRITVAAAGVHVIDTVLRRGEPGFPLPDLPTVPGREVAGTVDRIGAAVDESWLGATVVAHLGLAPGGYAQRAVTEVERLHRIPAGLDPAAAVAMIGTGRTALAILHVGTPVPGGVAVVTAAAGGIGTLLVQELTRTGMRVVGLAGGPEKTARVAANGAALAVDYREPDWADRVRERFGERPAALVFDGVGGESGRTATELLAPGGVHVVYGWSGGDPVTWPPDYAAARDIRSASALGPAVIDSAGGLRALETRALTAAAQGRLRPAIERFPLARAAAAHHAIETRATTGKVVLEP